MTAGEGAREALARYLKARGPGGRVLLARGEEERIVLRDMACGVTDESALDLADLTGTCRRCGESADPRPGVGTGDNGVMIVLNPPTLVGRAEIDLLRKESAELLKKIVAAAKLDASDCYITALVKCASVDPLMEPSQVVTNCSRILRRELEVKAPKVVMVFGDIRPLQPVIKESGDVRWFNLDHPVMMIKNPELKRRAWATLKLVMDKLAEA